MGLHLNNRLWMSAIFHQSSEGMPLREKKTAENGVGKEQNTHVQAIIILAC